MHQPQYLRISRRNERCISARIICERQDNKNVKEDIIIASRVLAIAAQNNWEMMRYAAAQLRSAAGKEGVRRMKYSENTPEKSSRKAKKMLAFSGKVCYIT